MKSFASATTACTVAVLALTSTSTVPIADERPLGHQASVVGSSAALSAAAVRLVEIGDVVRVGGRVAKRLTRGTATLLRVGAGRIDSSRIDARRHYALKGAAPLVAGKYSYAVNLRVKGTTKTIKRFEVTVVDPRNAPTPTPTPVPTGPRGDPSDWTYIGGTRVVRWDPCSTITWSVEGSAPYAESQADLDIAFARIAAATGLSFTQVADPHVSVFDVSWTNAAAAPVLAGSMLGFGEVSSYPQSNGQSKAVSGSVLLDFEHTLPSGFSALGASWGKVMLHEMSHAVGLGHATGAEQIMYPAVAATAAEFGAGDLTGLQAVGASQGCF